MKTPRVLNKILATALCCVMLLGLMSVTGGFGTAQAAESLPGIETIKSAGSFHILEITPSANQGSIGYYVGGSEPDGWRKTAAALTNSTSREDAVNAILQKLTDADIMSSGSNTPLTGSANYKEYYPWSTGLPEAHGSLTLDKPETVLGVPGTVTKNTNGNGAYDKSSTYIFQSDGTGDSVQVITSLSDSETSEGNYYYDLALGEAIPTYGSVSNGTLVAYKAEEGETAQFHIGENGYILVGVMGTDSFIGMDEDKDNYIISINGASKTRSDIYKYAATGSDFLFVGDSGHYFKRNNNGLTYVGRGGEYDFAYDLNGTKYDITTSTVFYTGGYTNNEWFKRYVLNYDENELANSARITVTTAAASTLSETEVASAQLIVISSGVSVDNSDESFSAENDVADTAALALLKLRCVTDKTVPIVFESSLYNTGATNIKGIITPLGGTSASTFCKGSVYASGSVMTTGFYTATAGSSANSTDPFYEVAQNIKYENYLRSREAAISGGTPVLLDTNVTMAASIRYIIASGRKAGVKTALRVLDLEPTSEVDAEINDQTVKSWLGDEYNTLPAGAIEVVHMPIYEFIGSIDDLTEEYDIVYVGSYFSGNTSTGLSHELYTNATFWNLLDYFKLWSPEAYTTDYIDDDMDGLIYANIGDKVVSGSDSAWFTNDSAYRLSGLLDRDFTTSGSGTGKIEALQKSPNDNSNSGTSGSGTYQKNKSSVTVGFSVTVTTTYLNEWGTTLLATITLHNSDYTATSDCTYNWYCDDVRISETSAYLHIDANSTYVNSVIRCEAIPNTIKNNGYYTLDKTKDQKAAVSPTYRLNGGGSGTNVIKTDDTSRTFRYSGNDLSAAALEKLEAFADAGCPVIYADNLANYAQSNYDTDFCVEGRAHVALKGFLKDPVFYPEASVKDDFSTVSVFPVGTQSGFFDIIKNYPIYSADCLVYPCDANGNQTGTPISPVKAYDNGEKAVFDLSGLEDGSHFYCTMKVTKLVVDKTPTEVSDIIYPPVNKAGKSCVYTVHKGANTERVDVNSRMNDLLEYISDKDNVFSVSSAKANTGLVSGYLGVSKPTIEFTENGAYPTKYAIDTDGKMTALSEDSNYDAAKKCWFLKYDFSIKNTTDASPAYSTYAVRLYLDYDHNGVYSDDEEYSDCWVGEGSSRVMNTELYQDKNYTLIAELDASIIGIIPWKLEVVKNGAGGLIHGSATDYTRIEPEEPETINILQIDSDANIKAGTGIDLETQFKDKTGDIGQFYGQVTKDFKFNVIRISAKDVENLTTADNSSKSFAAYRNTLKTDPDRTATRDLTQEEIMNSFDMLVLGFDDCYGELSETGAKAVKAFIANTDKAVLFSHDNASLFALPYGTLTDAKKNVYEAGWIEKLNLTLFGYQFNKNLRDIVGLDRYGVTNETYGQSKLEKGASTGGTVANGYAGATLTDILSAGYDVAYKPTKDKDEEGETVPETQGLTKTLLARYLESGHFPSYTVRDTGWNSGLNWKSKYNTTQIAQVNSGQITTYPFDVNTAAIKGTGKDNSITISSTHYQYHQLNMNPASNGDETVVWYCLSDKVYGYTPKDVVNNYYIYTKGNVTYTGLGHTTDGIPEDEAKLLINTLIAAYRSAKPSTSVKFTDKSGLTEPTSFLVPSDGGAPISGSATDSSRRIYFTAKNMSGAKNLKFTLGTDSDPKKNAVITAPKVYAAINNKETTAAQMESGYTYYIKYDDLPISGLSSTKPYTLGVFLTGEAEAPGTLTEIKVNDNNATVTDNGNGTYTLSATNFDGSGNGNKNRFNVSGTITISGNKASFSGTITDTKTNKTTDVTMSADITNGKATLTAEKFTGGTLNITLSISTTGGGTTTLGTVISSDSLTLRTFELFDLG